MPKDFTARHSSSEAQIENEILIYLNRIKGAFAWKNTSGGFYDGKKMRCHTSPFAIRGTSDVFCLYAGRFLVFEVKSKTGKATDEQLSFIQKIKACGGQGAVVRSVAEVRECFLEWFDVYVE